MKTQIEKYVIPRHTTTSEVVVCIYPSAIESFYDEQGNEMEIVCFQIENTMYEILNKQVNF